MFMTDCPGDDVLICVGPNKLRVSLDCLSDSLRMFWIMLASSKGHVSEKSDWLKAEPCSFGGGPR